MGSPLPSGPAPTGASAAPAPAPRLVATTDFEVFRVTEKEILVKKNGRTFRLENIPLTGDRNLNLEIAHVFTKMLQELSLKAGITDDQFNKAQELTFKDTEIEVKDHPTAAINKITPQVADKDGFQQVFTNLQELSSRVNDIAGRVFDSSFTATFQEKLKKIHEDPSLQYSVDISTKFDEAFRDIPPPPLPTAAPPSKAAAADTIEELNLDLPYWDLTRDANTVEDDTVFKALHQLTLKKEEFKDYLKKKGTNIESILQDLDENNGFPDTIHELGALILSPNNSKYLVEMNDHDIAKFPNRKILIDFLSPDKREIWKTIRNKNGGATTLHEP